MITNTYNAKTANFKSDNGGVEQGVITNKLIAYVDAVANSNCAPAPTTSFSKSLKRDDNPVAEEALSDGLGALFGAATGLDWVETFIDYAADAVELRDAYVADRPHYHVPRAPQPDIRIWPQPSPGYTWAA
jgi:hypothetical protein